MASFTHNTRYGNGYAKYNIALLTAFCINTSLEERTYSLTKSTKLIASLCATTKTNETIGVMTPADAFK